MLLGESEILSNPDNHFWLIGGAVAVVAIIGGFISSILRTRARERSRREIAAYIAEGAMSAEQGERLMRAGVSEDDAC